MRRRAPLTAALQVPYSRNGADPRPRRYSVHPRAPLLHVVVEEKLIWMRTQAKGVMLLALGRSPYFQEILGEHVALEQEVVIILERLDGFSEAARHLGYLGHLFGR